MSRRKRGWYWPWAIVGVIALQASVIIVTVFVAVGPESRAVEPDYYRQALRWDEKAAELRAADRLGWGVALNRTEPAAGGGWAFSVSVMDAEGGPIDDAAVTALAFPAADAASRVEFPLEPAGAGEYRGELASPRAGLWEVRLTITRGDERVLVIRKIDMG